jgi:ATP-dependent DNA helicase RecQ
VYSKKSVNFEKWFIQNCVAADEAWQPSPEDLALREKLRAWRRDRAQQLGIPAYTLFWDRTLNELCARCPKTPEALLTIWGIGEQKRRLIGNEWLAFMAAT